LHIDYEEIGQSKAVYILTSPE